MAPIKEPCPACNKKIYGKQRKCICSGKCLKSFHLDCVDKLIETEKLLQKKSIMGSSVYVCSMCKLNSNNNVELSNSSIHTGEMCKKSHDILNCITNDTDLTKVTLNGELLNSDCEREEKMKNQANSKNSRFILVNENKKDDCQIILDNEYKKVECEIKESGVGEITSCNNCFNCDPTFVKLKLEHIENDIVILREENIFLKKLIISLTNLVNNKVTLIEEKAGLESGLIADCHDPKRSCGLGTDCFDQEMPSLECESITDCHGQDESHPSVNFSINKVVYCDFQSKGGNTMNEINENCNQHILSNYLTPQHSDKNVKNNSEKIVSRPEGFQLFETKLGRDKNLNGFKNSNISEMKTLKTKASFRETKSKPIGDSVENKCTKSTRIFQGKDSIFHNNKLKVKLDSINPRINIQLFISRLKPDLKANQIASYIKYYAHLVDGITCYKLQTKYSNYSSFYVSGNAGDLKCIVNLEIWPRGTLVKSFYGNLYSNMIINESKIIIDCNEKFNHDYGNTGPNISDGPIINVGPITNDSALSKADQTGCLSPNQCLEEIKTIIFTNKSEVRHQGLKVEMANCRDSKVEAKKDVIGEPVDCKISEVVTDIGDLRKSVMPLTVVTGMNEHCQMMNMNLVLYDTKDGESLELVDQDIVDKHIFNDHFVHNSDQNNREFGADDIVITDN